LPPQPAFFTRDPLISLDDFNFAAKEAAPGFVRGFQDPVLPGRLREQLAPLAFHASA
jgi:hypothetical protein